MSTVRDDIAKIEEATENLRILRDLLLERQASKKAPLSAEQRQDVPEQPLTDYVALAARVTREAALRAVPREDEDDE